MSTLGYLTVPFSMYNKPKNIYGGSDVIELVETFQATPTKQDLATSQMFFSRFATKTPPAVSFIWESPTPGGPELRLH